MRFTLANLSTQGRDIKLSNKLVENSRNFITKIWNVARFAEFNNFSFDNNYSFSSNKLALNNWIVFRLYQTQKKICYGTLDSTFYRDDFRRRENPINANKTDLEIQEQLILPCLCDQQ